MWLSVVDAAALVCGLAVFSQVVPNVLACDQAVLNLDLIDESDILESFAIQSGALQHAVTKHRSGVALPAFFKLLVVLADADVARLCPFR